MILRTFVSLLLIVSAVRAYAQPPGDQAPACTLKTVGEVFAAYCGSSDANKALCEEPLRLTRDAERLMISSDYCALHPGAQRPGFCTCLGSVAPKILAFDHVEERWMPLGAHDPEHPSSTFWYESETLRGTPTVRIGSNEPLTVIVSRTNPLVFAANLGGPEVADVAELSAAKALLSAAGGTLATAIAATSANALDVAAATGTDQSVSDALKELEDLLAEWDQKVRDFSRAVDGISQQWSAVITSMQALEMQRSALRGGASRPPATAATAVNVFYKPNLEKWTQGLQEMTDLHARVSSCAADVDVGIQKFDALVKAMKLTSVCPLKLWRRELWVESKWDASTINRAVKILPVLADAQRRLGAALGSKEPIATSMSHLLETVGRLTRYAVRRSAPTRTDFIDTWNAMTAAEVQKLDLGAHLIVADEAMAGRWDHTQTYPVALNRTSGPLSQIVSPLRAGLTPKYRVQQKVWSTLGFSAGVLAKSAAQVLSWEKAGPEGAQYIRRANTSSRAGSVVLFLNYRFIESLNPRASTMRVRPGIEFGVAPDDTTPGLLLGVSFEVARIIRIGWGTSWFVLPELDDMAENDPIAKDASIRTRSVFKSGLPYVSLTFALDSLSLFSSK